MGLKVLFVLSVALLATCMGQNGTASNTNGQTGDGSTTSTEQSPLEKGMEPVFTMCHNFLDLVMPKNFYSESDTPFNAHELARIVNENDYGQLQLKWQDFVKTFGGLGGCMIVGLIFVVFMPLVGLIYCCCHCCCHKCGGTREMMDPKHASCKRWTLTIFLLICTSLMLAGAIIVFLGSDLLHRSLQNDDNNGLVGKMNTGLNNFQIFVNDSLNSIDQTVTDTVVKNGINEILPAVEGAANRTVARIKDSINATELLAQASSLGDAAVSIAGNLAQLGPILLSLRTHQTNVSGELTDVKNDVAAACTGIPSNDACTNMINTLNGLEFAPDFTQLDELVAQATDIKDAQEIHKFVEQASNSFNNVSDEVQSKVQTEITSATTEITNINTTINNEVKNLKGKADPLNDGIKNVQDSVNDDMDSVLKDVAKYVWYSCIGLGCAVLLTVFFYYMGVLYGLCGERAGHRAGCCNRDTGAGLLCTGICCSFLFAAILMLVVVLMFTVGGLSYSLGCKYTNDGVENIGDMESLLNDLNFNLTDALEFDGASSLTVAGMLRDCKDNKGVYSALHLQNLFDIDKEFNISDVLKQVDQMKTQIGNIVNVGNIELLSPELMDQLTKFKDSSIATVNFTEYTVQLNKQLFNGTELSSVITQLREASNAINTVDTTKAQQLNDSADQLVTLQSSTIAAIEVDMANLTTVVSNLQSEAQDTVTTKIDELITNIRNSETTFNTEAVRITKDELNKTVDAIKVLIIETVDDSKHAIKNDIGKCRPLYDSVQAAVDAVCIITVDPFNAIWFGLGWSLFFYIPSFILAAMLSSLYKRSEKYRQKRNFDDPIRSHQSGEYDNGYRGGRHDDNVPLTSMGKDQRTNSNGAYNYGYQGRDNDPRYHRDSYPNHTPEHDRGAPRGARLYAEPHMDPYDQPPLYDDAISPQYDRVGHNGYPSGRRY